MSDANVVGSAAFELRATRDKLKEDLRQSELDLKRSVGLMEREAGAGADRIGSGLTGMARSVTNAITAMVAILATAITFAIQAGGASLKMADQIASAANRIGIGTSALQEFQYVARKTGEDAKAVEGSLESFSNKLAQAGAGLSKDALNSFKALGFSQEQLRSFKDTDTALNAVIDRIGELKNASDRVAIAEKMGLGPLASALRDGAEEMDRLRQEAAELGFVMDASLVQKGAEAQGQLDDLSKIIGIQMAEAFIGLSDEVLSFTTAIADALRGLNNFIDSAKLVRRAFGGEFGFGDAVGMAATPGGLIRGATRAVRGVIAGPQFVDRSALADLAAGTGDYAPPRPRRVASLSGRDGLTPVQPRGRTDNSAQRAAEREARRAERVQDEIYRARQRALQIEEKDLLTVQQRYDLNQRQNVLEREGEDAKLKSRLARKDILEGEFNQLTLQNTQNRALEDRIAKDLLGRDLQDERLANEKALTDLTAQLLSLQSGAARTVGERKAIEHRLLAISQKDARDALETQLRDTPDLSDDVKQQRRDALAQVQTAQKDAVDRSNLTPLEAWRDAALKNAAEVRQAYEGIAANGLDALNSGIVDAIMNTRSLGEVFSNVARQILADLVSISVRQSITQPLAKMLFGSGESGGGVAGSVSGGGNWLKTAFSFGKRLFSGGFAEGGYTGDGGRDEPAGIVHRGEYVFSKAAVSRIGAGNLETMHRNLQGFAVGGLVGAFPAVPALTAGMTGAPSAGSGVSVTFAPVIHAEGAGPREIDILKGELARMQRELPGTIVNTVADARGRRVL